MQIVHFYILTLAQVAPLIQIFSSTTVIFYMRASDIDIDVWLFACLRGGGGGCTYASRWSVW